MEPNINLTSEVIKDYFDQGYTYAVILDMLSTLHNIKMSLRSLKTRLKETELFRRKDVTLSPLVDVRNAILMELRGPGRLFGYQTMWQVLKQKYKLTVKRSAVMRLLKQLYAQGTDMRTRHRFVRRIYHSMGPNYIWHVVDMINLNHLALLYQTV